ncbi:MAG: FIST N-terminal domain-containing protein [Armatimonadota bacterium]|nr:FIST C-terminal domain-containing protein [bacterium]
MRIATSWSELPDTACAVREAFDMLLERLGNMPNIIVIQSTEQYDFNLMISLLGAFAPNTRIHGSTSSVGVMTEDGFHSKDSQSIGFLGIYDPDGSYGVGAVAIDDDAQAAASKAIEVALTDADRPGEIPGFVLLACSPNNEEAIIHGIQDVIGPGVPIIGGTSADNMLDCHWKQFTSSGVYSEAIEVTTVFPSVEFGYSFHSGFSPSAKTGRVTRANDRTIYEIDGRPAVSVYYEWLGESVAKTLPKEGYIFKNVKHYPHAFGRIIGTVENVPYYLISQPHTAMPDGSLLLFTQIETGDEIILMSEPRSGLISKAGRVVQAAMNSADMSPQDVCGVLLMCCAGYLLPQDEMNAAAQTIRAAVGGKPFLSAFSYGEQGPFVSGENRHGNLMVSALVFGENRGLSGD